MSVQSKQQHSSQSKHRDSSCQALRRFAQQNPAIITPEEVENLLRLAEQRGVSPERFAEAALSRLSRMAARAEAAARMYAPRDEESYLRILQSCLPADAYAISQALLLQMQPELPSDAFPFSGNVALFIPFLRFPALVLSRKRQVTITDGQHEYKRQSPYRGMSPHAAVLLDFVLSRAIENGVLKETQMVPVYAVAVRSDEVARLFGWKRTRTDHVHRLFESLAFALDIRGGFNVRTKMLVCRLHRRQRFGRVWDVFVGARFVEALRQRENARFVYTEALCVMARMTALGQALARWLSWHLHGKRATVYPVAIGEERLAEVLMGIRLESDGTKRWFPSEVRRAVREVNETRVLEMLGVWSSYVTVRYADGHFVFSRER